jgi:iron(III) transport system ATP-binding protein
MTTTTQRSMTTEVGRLAIEGLVKTFSTDREPFTAVDHIGLDIEPGEFITLLGPSGCGKTTTLRMIAGFEQPTAGSVTLDGADMLRLSPDKRPMSMVFQSYALFPHLSVFENVAYGLSLQRLSKARIRDEVARVLGSMNLDHLADRDPGQLSGGQQQRVALARAMVMRPKVLLFDEPLSNLDAKLRVHMRTEIRTLQQDLGITSIYVTHDQDEAMSLSDRIVVMNAGRIEQADVPAEIYRHPTSVFVADFIGRANFLTVHDVRPAGEGRVSLTVIGRRVTVPSHPDAPAGPATLLVRPESVRLSTPAVGREANGTVAMAVFYGESVEYTIDTEDGQVVAVVSDPEVETILEPGSRVVVGFEESRSWLLPRAD